jgi:hypothetical protein
MMTGVRTRYCNGHCGPPRSAVLGSYCSITITPTPTPPPPFPVSHSPTLGCTVTNLANQILHPYVFLTIATGFPSHHELCHHRSRGSTSCPGRAPTCRCVFFLPLSHHRRSGTVMVREEDVTHETDILGPGIPDSEMNIDQSHNSDRLTQAEAQTRAFSLTIVETSMT